MKRLVVALLFGVGLWVGCDDVEPIELDPCDGVDCEEGLFCESGECVCDEYSCGEAASCDEGECVDDPARACEQGAKWVEAEGCTCDEDGCDEIGGNCVDGGCLIAGDGAECVDAVGDWDGEQQIFADRSEEAGLVDLDVEGVRLAAGDVTGNGVPELFVRSPLSGSDDFGEDGDRESWLLANQGDGTFEDITEESGIVQQRYGEDEDRGRPMEVVAMADVNNSGALDVVTLFSNTDGDSEEGAEVMLNDGEGNFELGPVSEPLHAAGEITARSGAAFLDVDRDGTVDLWMSNAAPGGSATQDRLLLGDGSGEFTDVTEERGLVTLSSNSNDVRNAAEGHSNAWAAGACDLDGNSREELLASSYGRMPNHLWDAQIDDGKTTYDNHSVDSGYAFDHRKDWTDNESARCWCMHNREDEECEEVPEPEHIQCNSASDACRWNHNTDREPWRLGGNSGTTVCADLNNNGLLDLLTTEIVHWDVGESSDPSEILYNTGESPVTFERPGNEETGLQRPRDGVVWDDGDITAAAFDFDNSGRLDILIASTDYPGTRAHLFHQQPDGTFELVDVELGVDLTSAHGIAIADFDRSGALDVAIGHSRARCDAGDHCLDDSHVRLFGNEIGADNNWIQLDLEGPDGANRAAIGAKVTVVTEDFVQVSEVDGGHGHYGMQHDLVQHFGLGSHCEAKVIIDWPDADGTRDVVRLEAGERYKIGEAGVGW